jgi:hypothetical protein
VDHGWSSPDYDHLLNPEEVDGQYGPWALLEGYIEQSAPSDDRRIFSFLRGVFVEAERATEFCDTFDLIDYPGNQAIPEMYDDIYTYAGEIPWSPRFGTGLRDETGAPIRNLQEAFAFDHGSRQLPKIPVEVPVHRFGWEGYHSELNQVSGILVPAPALCERLGLLNHQGEWDLYDERHAVASLWREFKHDRDTFASHLAYLRCDLLASYLAHTGQVLIWLVWGERELHHKKLISQMDALREVWRERLHVHKRRRLWAAESSSGRTSDPANSSTPSLGAQVP